MSSNTPMNLQTFHEETYSCPFFRGPLNDNSMQLPMQLCTKDYIYIYIFFTRAPFLLKVHLLITVFIVTSLFEGQVSMKVQKCDTPSR